ncbi:RNA binding protein [Fusarium pseudoanthophilum]|uniref:RNA binding protein n=1 Tax=Fusarium pseudoanthophilum TaxID=48495 RepID=A0A8H5PNK3_9HYPO|nr:RNA binding protein [Fusarium pseudoanthophilum]
MSSNETPEKKIYVWPIDDAETDRLSGLLKMDFKTFNMKQHYLHSPQYVCHTCGKLTGLDDSVGTALAMGAHDAQFVIDYIKNPTPRIFHAHELQCCVDGTTYLERYSMERPEGQALKARFEALKASGGTPAPLPDDAAQGDSARLEYVPTWFRDQHVASGEGDTAKVEYYPKWFAGNAALVSYYPKWFSSKDPTASPALEKHTGKVDPEGTVEAKAADTASGENAKFEYPVRWFEASGDAAKFKYPVRWFDASGENAKFEYPVRWFTASGETANFEYPVRWFEAKEDGGANSDEAAKVKYYPKWFAGPEDGVLDTAKLEYYPKWFTGPDAVTALNAKGENATFEYYPKWFAAEGSASPGKEDAVKATGASDKPANVLYYPKWFASN